MTTPTRISNRNARQYVERLIPFKGSNLFSRITERGDYAVFSYGPHHPLVVGVPFNGRTLWFANKYKRSVTTTRHLNQSLPLGVDVTWLDPDQMRTLVRDGYEILIRKQLSL